MRRNNLPDMHGSGVERQATRNQTFLGSQDTSATFINASGLHSDFHKKMFKNDRREVKHKIIPQDKIFSASSVDNLVHS